MICISVVLPDPVHPIPTTICRPSQVPDEPTAGEGIVQVAFRLPSGQRVARRFCVSDHTVGMMQAFVSGEMQGRKVTLSTSFPNKVMARLC